MHPDLGSLEDLKAFVRAAHDLGMYVILDLVANHTARDNPLVTEHPEWYARDWKGDVRPTPWWELVRHRRPRRVLTRADAAHVRLSSSRGTGDPRVT